MKITKINTGIIKNPTSKVLGMATIEIDGILVLNNIKIIDGAKGLFLGMPSMKTTKDGKEEYRDVFYITSEKARDYITSEVIKSFTKKLEKYESENTFDNEFVVDDNVPF